MTGSEHYLAAEQAASGVNPCECHACQEAPPSYEALALAQLHAMLALVAAVTKIGTTIEAGAR